MNTIKQITLVLAVIVTFIGCQKEPLDEVATNQDTALVIGGLFPVELSVEAFFAMNLESKLNPETNRLVEFGAYNEEEWFIKDRRDNTQYYILDAETNTLNATNRFSGRIVDLESRLDGSGRTVCSFSNDNGCSITVNSNWWVVSVTFTCGDETDTDTFPGGYAVAGPMCAAAAITMAL